MKTMQGRKELFYPVCKAPQGFFFKYDANSLFPMKY